MTMNIILTTLLAVAVFVLSCEKEESNGCGCDSTVTFEYVDMTGNISYKWQLDPNDNFYIEKFWIGFTEPDCVNCGHSLIVCNEEILTDFKNLINLPPEASVLIKFSGYRRTLCEKIFAPAGYTYDHITLTKIEKL